jgi:hypothetical protein
MRKEDCLPPWSPLFNTRFTEPEASGPVLTARSVVEYGSNGEGAGGVEVAGRAGSVQPLGRSFDR